MKILKDKWRNWRWVKAAGAAYFWFVRHLYSKWLATAMQHWSFSTVWDLKLSTKYSVKWVKNGCSCSKSIRQLVRPSWNRRREQRRHCLVCWVGRASILGEMEWMWRSVSPNDLRLEFRQPVEVDEPEWRVPLHAEITQWSFNDSKHKLCATICYTECEENK